MSYFFCGIGGSGMLPLASILRGLGHEVKGSDRALDQGRTGAKFDWLRAQGIELFPQDGSGLKTNNQILVASAAIEDSVPDVMASRELGLVRMSRPELLSQLFNAAPQSIGIAGTSGKSTVTGMVGWILYDCGRDPTVMNGAVMKNFADGDAPFASALVGTGDAFVSEIDESDGSIALYDPKIAVLNNVSLDHKSMEELRELFGAFLRRAGQAIVNADDAEAARIASKLPVPPYVFGFESDTVDLRGKHLRESPLSVSFAVEERQTGHNAQVKLAVPGRHNAQNALAAISAATAAGISLTGAARSIARYQGLKRRFDIVGTAGGITVIDDFGHNPDKVAATLSTLQAFPGRLLLFFQPHGFGPLRQMGSALASTLIEKLGEKDRIIFCDPVYFGGTTDRSIGSKDIVDAIVQGGAHAEYLPDRADCGARLVELAEPGDRIVIMGARDDSLSKFAAKILADLI